MYVSGQCECFDHLLAHSPIRVFTDFFCTDTLRWALIGHERIWVVDKASKVLRYVHHLVLADECHKVLLRRILGCLLEQLICYVFLPDPSRGYLLSSEKVGRSARVGIEYCPLQEGGAFDTALLEVVTEPGCCL